MKKKQPVLKGILVLLAILIFIPVWMVIVAAFSDEKAIAKNGFSLWAATWSLDGMRYVMRFGSQLVNAYEVTLLVTIGGTLLTLFFTSLFAYALSRNDFILRKPLTVYLLITMIFSGGQLGSYLINSNVFNLRNSLLVLILPGCIGAMNCIIMRSFIQANVPDALVEAAEIDGANEYKVFFRIVLPLMTPVLGAIGFMTAVGHWNQWQTSMLYIDKRELTTLQQLLMRIENTLEYLSQTENVSVSDAELWASMPTESGRMALLLCTLGPVLVIYPFFQKYFVKGLTIGAVK